MPTRKKTTDAVSQTAAPALLPPETAALSRNTRTERSRSAAQNQFARLPDTPTPERKDSPRREIPNAIHRLSETCFGSSASPGSVTPPTLPSTAARPKKRLPVPMEEKGTATREESAPAPDGFAHSLVPIPVRPCFSHRRDCRDE